MIPARHRRPSGGLSRSAGIGVHDAPGITVSGVQCHIGSQITDLEPLEEAARELAALSRRLLADGFPLETIDVGGGLGVDYEGGVAPAPCSPASST